MVSSLGPAARIIVARGPGGARSGQDPAGCGARRVAGRGPPGQCRDVAG
ncbi:hypothetical protein SLNWT_7144 [Streptomyces albus]|uniref:Uncharacterized protein n=1 Tax=Streptomyces albus (strain ATCC 21838 / DSM 41398 / FERM P-419 / JCM 4703 / NBRC 107858) TaxID=1081613 RepID=A0A0B5F7H3_STRA4|nr:hypothetical protein SLNWT_7144 [Streptomyces albus]AOU81824.1 hypothetical protein SLNHY_7133 [Streptomyces albus]